MAISKEAGKFLEPLTNNGAPPPPPPPPPPPSLVVKLTPAQEVQAKIDSEIKLRGLNFETLQDKKEGEKKIASELKGEYEKKYNENKVELEGSLVKVEEQAQKVIGLKAEVVRLIDKDGCELHTRGAIDKHYHKGFKDVKELIEDRQKEIAFFLTEYKKRNKLYQALSEGGERKVKPMVVRLSNAIKLNEEKNQRLSEQLKVLTKIECDNKIEVSEKFDNLYQTQKKIEASSKYANSKKKCKKEKSRQALFEEKVKSEGMLGLDFKEQALIRYGLMRKVVRRKNLRPIDQSQFEGVFGLQGLSPEKHEMQIEKFAYLTLDEDFNKHFKSFVKMSLVKLEDVESWLGRVFLEEKKEKPKVRKVKIPAGL